MNFVAYIASHDILNISHEVHVGSSRDVARWQIDDPIDAFAVHGVAGAWGVLAAAIFDWGSLDGRMRLW